MSTLVSSVKYDLAFNICHFLQELLNLFSGITTILFSLNACYIVMVPL